MTLKYLIGDVFERLADIPDGSVDLIVTSPPFLALRSYLPADHPDKHREIGSEATPADFLDTLLALTQEWGRVLAPHGSLCVELGDTYSGSGGAGGDYSPGGLRDGQERFDGSASKAYGTGAASRPERKRTRNTERDAPGWPLAKSKAMLDTLYPACLAYGRNLLRPDAEPIDPWRIRNLIVWARPNPPVGALGDKFRPATSYITVACKGSKRYFDLDAVRVEPAAHSSRYPRDGEQYPPAGDTGARKDDGQPRMSAGHPAGSPPLDWHADGHPEDGDWLWKLSTSPYKGAHYATFPMALPKRLIEAMCPLKVCTVCGQPSTRVIENHGSPYTVTYHQGQAGGSATGGMGGHVATRNITTIGWTDCGHDTWRTGIVLDPFAGSGTTLDAAQAVGRHALGIDLDPRNADLARARVGMFLDVDV